MYKMIKMYQCNLVFAGEGSVSALSRCIRHFMLPQASLQGRVVLVHICKIN